MEETPFTDRLDIVCAFNDVEILDRNLRASPIILEGAARLTCYFDYPSAGIAYNAGILDTQSELIVFAHQDVFLPDGWDIALRRAVLMIEEKDPHWAAIGAFGVDVAGNHVGHVWSSGMGRTLGGYFDVPVEAASMDELLIVLRRGSAVSFDADLPSFHLFGTDIVQIARLAGLKSYIANIPVIHNSRPLVSYAGGFSEAWNYMRHKWREHLPLPTLTVSLTPSPFTLLRARFRVWRTFGRRRLKAVDHRTDPRELIRHLDLR